MTTTTMVIDPVTVQFLIRIGIAGYETRGRIPEITDDGNAVTIQYSSNWYRKMRVTVSAATGTVTSVFLFGGEEDHLFVGATAALEALDHIAAGDAR